MFSWVRAKLVPVATEVGGGNCQEIAAGSPKVSSNGTEVAGAKSPALNTKR